MLTKPFFASRYVIAPCLPLRGEGVAHARRMRCFFSGAPTLHLYIFCVSTTEERGGDRSTHGKRQTNGFLRTLDTGIPQSPYRYGVRSPLKKLVGSPKDVINTDIIKIGKSAQHLRRHHSLTALIIGVRPLRNIYGLTHLLLREVCIFSEVSNTLISLQSNHQFKYSLNKLVYCNFEHFVLNYTREVISCQTTKRCITQ